MQSADFIVAALVAIVCGTFAQLTSAYSRGGWWVHLGIGFAGAVIGVVVSRALNAPVIYNVQYRMIDYPIIYSVVGSALLLAALGFLIKPHR